MKSQEEEAEQMMREQPPAPRVRITALSLTSSLELAVALVALAAWLAMQELAPLLIAAAVLVSGPLEARVRKLCGSLLSRWGGEAAGRQGPRLIALLCLLWAALA